MAQTDAIAVLSALWTPGSGAFWKLQQSPFDVRECERVRSALAQVSTFDGDFIPREAVSLLWGVPRLLETARKTFPDSKADMAAWSLASSALASEVDRILGGSAEARSDGNEATLQTPGTRYQPAFDRKPEPPRAPPLPPSENRFDARFRTVRELARGGMGRVLLAEDTALHREVAVKEMIGEQSVDAVRRFEREALLTARLQHPGIVSVHEFSNRASGEPCLVMRHVRGEPFHVVIHRADTLEKRLRLLGPFISICDALAYAHKQGVIHRDLKPSNTLLGEFGDTVVIDWGLAKDLRAPAEDEPARKAGDRIANSSSESGLTQVGQLMGTPEYMSPEQARGEPADEQSDVFALGAILYHLLSGQLPYPRQKGSDGDDVVEAVIAGPPLPLARRAPGLVPELVTVVERAMARNRYERFANAGELAEELKRFQAGGLVRAHDYSIGELFVRWARRNSATLLVSGVFLAVLAALAVVSVRRIVSERDRANREAETSKRVAGFLTGMFKVSAPSEARGNSLTAREVLDRASSQIDSGLAKEPETQSLLMSVMGDVYEDLGLFPRAEELMKKALALREKANGERSPETAKALTNLASIIYQEGRLEEAGPLMREALLKTQRAFGPDSREALAAEGNLANLEDDLGHSGEAERLIRDSLERRLRLFGADDSETLQLKGNLAFVLAHSGQNAEAIPLLREALAGEERVLGEDDPRTLESLSGLAVLLGEEARYTEAEQVELKAIAAKKRVDGPDHPDTLLALGTLGGIYEDEARYPEAEKLLRETIAAEIRVVGPLHPDTLEEQFILASVLLHRKQYAEAESLLKQTLEQRGKALGPEDPSTIDSESGLGQIYKEEGRYAEAAPLLIEALDLRKRLLGPKSAQTGASYYNLACLEAREGNKEKALDYLRAAVPLLTPRISSTMREDTDLKSLFGDPRFEALAAAARPPYRG